MGGVASLPEERAFNFSARYIFCALRRIIVLTQLKRGPIFCLIKAAPSAVSH
jgi:hypothetical protein